VHASLDLEILGASLRGYVAGLGRALTADERARLLLGVEWVSLELAARFAADALFESYFGWDATRFAGRGEHNLVRARGQWSLHEALVATRAERAGMLQSPQDVNGHRPRPPLRARTGSCYCFQTMVDSVPAGFWRAVSAFESNDGTPALFEKLADPGLGTSAPGHRRVSALARGVDPGRSLPKAASYPRKAAYYLVERAMRIASGESRSIRRAQNRRGPSTSVTPGGHSSSDR
jgi:hypothetical protein